MRDPITHTDYGKWGREHIIDPLIYRKTEVHSRNYEASYDVAELEPKSRAKDTYVLEEYFCPVWRINEFVPKMREILGRYNANVINISIRHALPDDGSLLAWASEEVFAFVIYYNQETTTPARREVAVWTRELIDAVISVGWRYYLPYQLHGTLSQVKRAYPRFDEYIALKSKYDPTGKLSNSLLEKYYFWVENIPQVLGSRFRTVYDTPLWRDRFYVFLQNIFQIAPTHEFHSLIWDIVERYTTDREIYDAIQKYGIPALKKQKQEMSRQAHVLLWDTSISGYLEIWWAGRYIQPMRDRCDIQGEIYLISDEPIDSSPVRIIERGQLGKYNTKKLTYTPEDFDHIPDGSIGLVSIFIWLHHCPLENLDIYIASFIKKLQPNGHIILRDHNVTDDLMHTFVAIAHDIYNAGTWATWEANSSELRHFRSIADWQDIFKKHGFKQIWESLLQDHDPTDNTLMHFIHI
jgi:Methyltransferase domain